MTAPVTVDDRELMERLRTMCSHRGDGIATQFVNPDGPEAADRIETLRDTLQNIYTIAVASNIDGVSRNGEIIVIARAALTQTEVP